MLYFFAMKQPLSLHFTRFTDVIFLERDHSEAFCRSSDQDVPWSNLSLGGYPGRKEWTVGRLKAKKHQ